MNWINVKDKLPTKEECEIDAGWFLVIRKNLGRADISRYDGHDKEHAYEHGWKYAWDYTITHWMPLPKPPDEAESPIASG